MVMWVAVFIPGLVFKIPPTFLTCYVSKLYIWSQINGDFKVFLVPDVLWLMGDQ